MTLPKSPLWLWAVGLLLWCSSPKRALDAILYIYEKDVGLDNIAPAALLAVLIILGLPVVSIVFQLAFSKKRYPGGASIAWESWRVTQRNWTWFFITCFSMGSAGIYATWFLLNAGAAAETLQMPAAAIAFLCHAISELGWVLFWACWWTAFSQQNVPVPTGPLRKRLLQVTKTG